MTNLVKKLSYWEKVIIQNRTCMPVTNSINISLHIKSFIWISWWIC